MRYKNMVSGIFLARPNRFIAHVQIDGQVEICHVKNTGRCRELLVPGTIFSYLIEIPRTKRTPHQNGAGFGGDYRTRTCDLMRVKHAL